MSSLNDQFPASPAAPRVIFSTGSPDRQTANRSSHAIGSPSDRLPYTNLSSDPVKMVTELVSAKGLKSPIELASDKMCPEQLMQKFREHRIQHQKQIQEEKKSQEQITPASTLESTFSSLSTSGSMDMTSTSTCSLSLAFPPIFPSLYISPCPSPLGDSVECQACHAFLKDADANPSSTPRYFKLVHNTTMMSTLCLSHPEDHATNKLADAHMM
jgi:hypothetical protein